MQFYFINETLFTYSRLPLLLFIVVVIVIAQALIARLVVLSHEAIEYIKRQKLSAKSRNFSK